MHGISIFYSIYLIWMMFHWIKNHIVGLCRTIDIHCLALTEYNYIVRRIMAIDSHTQPTSNLTNLYCYYYRYLIIPVTWMRPHFNNNDTWDTPTVHVKVHLQIFFTCTVLYTIFLLILSFWHMHSMVCTQHNPF